MKGKLDRINNELIEKLMDFCRKWSINESKYTMNSSVRVDLGINGDDAIDFLKDFEREFKRELDIDDLRVYFHDEIELKNKKWYLFKRLNMRKIENELTISGLWKISVPSIELQS